MKNSESLKGLELGEGCGPFLSIFTRNINNSTQLYLKSVDTSQSSTSYAEYNISKALSFHNNPNDSMDVKCEDWNVTLNKSDQYDVIYFNPPYLPYGEKVRDEMSGAPEEAIYTPDGKDGLVHYKNVAPKLKAVITPGGIIIVRTPNDDNRFMQIRGIVDDVFGGSESRFIVHNVRINSELGERNGRGLLIQAETVQATEYSVDPVNHIGGYILHANGTSDPKKRVLV